MATTGISQKEYLKKYLSSGSDDKKKKKKKLKSKPAVNRMRIVDDDIDVSSMQPLDDVELELYELQEDAPQIAGIIDERPEEVKIKERFGTKKWRVVADDNDTGVKVIDKLSSNVSSADIKVKAEANDGDVSSPRRIKTHLGENSSVHSPDNSPQRQSHKQNNSDESPSRIRRKATGLLPDKEKTNYNCDESPPGKSKQNDSESTHVNKSKNKYDSDESPPRKSKRNDSESMHVNKSKNKYDFDESPPRKSKRNDSESVHINKTKGKYDTDESPPRKTKQRDNEGMNLNKGRYQHDSDESPPRRPRNNDTVNKQVIKGKHRDDSDESPPRKSRKSETQISRSKYDSDESPPRRNQKRDIEMPYPRKDQKHDSDESPPRRSKRDGLSSQDLRKGERYDSDESPPKRGKPRNFDMSSKKEHYYRSEDKWDHRRGSSTHSRSYRNSPPRIKLHEHLKQSHKKSDSDESPPRKNKRRLSPSPNRSRRDSWSPQRNHEKRKSRSPTSQKPSRWTDADERRYYQRDSAKYRAPSPRSYKDHSASHRDNLIDRGKDGRSSLQQKKQETDKSPERSKNVPKNDHKKQTTDGRKAGLVDAGELKAEIADMRQREKQVFQNMDPSISGKDAAPIMRDRKTGKKRDMEEEARIQKEKDAKQAVRDAKYMQWGKGLKQVSDQEQKMKDALHEMSKPLARYADDEDLDKLLREQEREGDPMLAYIKNKSKSKDKDEKGKPQYEGTYMPNRFSVRPGYRWDGVDRSNGYEKQWFEAQNARKAVEEEAYKWSTSDM